jgi:hypothetical protein
MKTILDFQKFECNVAKLDKIKGGRELVEIVVSAVNGLGMGGKRCNEYLLCYDDGSWGHRFVYAN